MQRERWVVIGALSTIALIASVCTTVLPKFAVDAGAVLKSDPSLLLVSENSPYMRNER
ncbi:hypothetical protein ABH995_006823 [Bradyrhizobium yuanmingense]